MTLRWIGRHLIEHRGYRGLAALACPILVRYCHRHQRYEWYDPINRRGSTARTFDSLIKQLRRHFYCKQCGLYHVDNVAIVLDEDIKSRKYKLKEVDFNKFIGASSWEEVSL